MNKLPDWLTGEGGGRDEAWRREEAYSGRWKETGWKWRGDERGVCLYRVKVMARSGQVRSRKRKLGGCDVSRLHLDASVLCSIFFPLSLSSHDQD